MHNRKKEYAGFQRKSQRRLRALSIGDQRAVVAVINRLHRARKAAKERRKR